MRRVVVGRGAVPSPVPPGTGDGRFSRLLRALCVAVTAVFLFAFWGRNAAGLGRQNAGLALALSLLVPLALYASLALAVMAALVSVVAWWRGYATRVPFTALVVALVPLVVLLLADLL